MKILVILRYLPGATKVSSEEAEEPLSICHYDTVLFRRILLQARFHTRLYQSSGRSWAGTGQIIAGETVQRAHF